MVDSHLPAPLPSAAGGVIYLWADNPSKKLGAIIALLDGAADESIPALADKTPLEAARKPFIDRLASSGLVGYTGTYLHTHHFLTDLLAEGDRVSRGILEALALGIPLREGMIVYRLSPARISRGSIRLEYALPIEELQNLESLADKMLPLLSDLDPRIYFNSGRGVLILKRAGFKPAPTSLFEDNPLEALPKILQDFVSRIALRNSGLTLIPWGGDLYKKPNLRPRTKKLSILSNSPAVCGLAKVLNLKAYKIRNLDDLPNQAQKLLESENKNLLIHFEQPDEESHRRSYTGKVLAIEKIDRLLEELYSKTGAGILLVIDHAASSITGRHFRAKTPFLYAEKPAEEKSRSFHEKILGRFVPADKLLRLISR